MSFGLAPTASSQEFAPDRIIVKFKPGLDARSKADATRGIGAELRDLRLIDAAVVQVEHRSVEAAVAKALQDPRVAYAEPDWILKADVDAAERRIPNDPRFGDLYGLHNTGQTGGAPGADIHAAAAWAVFTGEPDLLVGVIDTGVDYNHPDLAANIWTNAAEAAGTRSIDDDGNGYVDDLHGYDFVHNDGDPMDDHGHGTHVSGTIAAVGDNGIGVTGIDWRCRIVGIKFMDQNGSGATSDAIRALEYAIAVGARLTNNSWGGGSFSRALQDAITAAGRANQLFVAAAGNNAKNNDATPHYPSSYANDNILSVAASDDHDGLAPFSSYGRTSVDIAAPGVGILSCLRGGGYGFATGTSMAAPHVTGVAALVFGRSPGIAAARVKEFIIALADPVPALATRTVAGGRLNALSAVTAEPDATPPAAVNDLAITSTGSTTVELRWQAPGDDGMAGQARRSEVRSSTAPLDAANFAHGIPVVTSPAAEPGTEQRAEARGLAYDTDYWFAVEVFDEWGNASLSNIVTTRTLGAPQLTVMPPAPVDLVTGAVVTRKLTLSNTAAGRLDFTVVAPDLSPAAPSGSAREPRTEAFGGGDAFGYRWQDSEHDGGPAYDWVDIRSVGTLVQFPQSDFTQGPFPIGFDFPYYGRTVSQVRICLFGWLSFYDTQSEAPTPETLPTGSLSPAPHNMVAPLWHHYRTALERRRVYYHNDGSRFILTWFELEADTADPNRLATFQLILYPSGEIRFQYQRIPPSGMGPYTIGIQNLTRQVGLQVGRDSPSVRSGLALSIYRLPQWLRAAPMRGTIPAGQHRDVTLTFDAAGLKSGLYTGFMHIETNDRAGRAQIPVSLGVTGAPNLVAPRALDLGPVFVGRPKTRSINIKNNGVDDLVVESIVGGDAALSVQPFNFTLPPGAIQRVALTYAPTAPARLQTTLRMRSNDPDAPVYESRVTAQAAREPNLVPDIESIDLRVVPGISETRRLALSNQPSANGAPLEFTITPVEMEAMDAKPTSVARARPRSRGGPDGFGYTWTDSDQPGGPDYAWVDLTPIGTRIPFNGDDQTRGPFELPFKFPFYGELFDAVYVCTNGWLSFTSPGTQAANRPLPGTALDVPGALLAPFWDDLSFALPPLDPYPPRRALAYYYGDRDRFVVSYIDVKRSVRDSRGLGLYDHPYDFQVILYSSGRIVFQYRDLDGPRDLCTVGIQNRAGTAGLQIASDRSYLHAGLAIEMQKPPRWLNVSPVSGSIDPDQSREIEVRIDADGLAPGEYSGFLRIATNDPDKPLFDVPVVLQVGAPTDVAAALPKRFGLEVMGRNPSRDAVGLRLALPSREMVDLRIYDVRGALVRTLERTLREPGLHLARWNGLDDQGRRVAAGTYFVRMRAGPGDATARVTWVH